MVVAAIFGRHFEKKTLFRGSYFGKLRHIIFTNKVTTAKAVITPERLLPNLQQDFIANVSHVCTSKLWYGWGWQIK